MRGGAVDLSFNTMGRRERSELNPTPFLPLARQLEVVAAMETATTFFGNKLAERD
jgi:hypothetical protein